MKKKLVSLLLSFSVAFSLTPALAAEPLPFMDIQSSQWFYPYVEDLYHAGIINGTSATTFTPKGTVTLGEALKLILLAAGFEPQDPTTTHWASGYYRLASKQNLLGSAARLTLDQPINRQQIAEIAANALHLSRTNHKRTPFYDTSDLAALKLYDHGIITGVLDKTTGHLLFNPTAQITRAEISAIIWRMEQHQASQMPDPEPTEPVTPENPEKTDPGSETDPAAENEPAPDPEPDETDSGDAPADEPAQNPEPDAENNPETPPEPEAPKTYLTFRGSRIPVVETLPKNTYDNDCFQVNENGYLTYDSEEYTCKIGIDVSKYQGDIDWAAVRDAGIEFAILRLGYRGYGTGKLVMDPTFYQNIQGALDNGIEVGVYVFSQALNAQEGAEEARFAVNALQNYHITYPIVFDWEPYDASVGARTNGLSDSQLTAAAVAFCETVEALGYQAMVYANLTYFYLHFDLNQLTSYPFWLAQYNSRPSFYYHFDIWQYGSNGTVPGINGDTDMNIQFIPK